MEDIASNLLKSYPWSSEPLWTTHSKQQPWGWEACLLPLLYQRQEDGLSQRLEAILGNIGGFHVNNSNTGWEVVFEFHVNHEWFCSHNYVP